MGSVPLLRGRNLRSKAPFAIRRGSWEHSRETANNPQFIQGFGNIGGEWHLDESPTPPSPTSTDQSGVKYGQTTLTTRTALGEAFLQSWKSGFLLD